MIKPGLQIRGGVGMKQKAEAEACDAGGEIDIPE